MIEGLKVTLQTEELRNLCHQHADHHRDRAVTYATQMRNLAEADIEAADFTGGDPTRAMREKQVEHEDRERELRFIAEHLKAGEEYLLDDEALQRVGVLKGRRMW